jgi:hypothetical protein
MILIETAATLVPAGAADVKILAGAAGYETVSNLSSIKMS